MGGTAIASPMVIAGALLSLIDDIYYLTSMENKDRKRRCLSSVE